MKPETHTHPLGISAGKAAAVLIALGGSTFIYEMVVGRPERAWQAYLINFLLFSAVAQGAVVFSALMHVVKARWTGSLDFVAESFTAFFPASFLLFLGLFLGRDYVFPWRHENLHGKEVWLNLPFLFGRDAVGLLLLYGVGFAYLYHALHPRLDRSGPGNRLREMLYRRWKAGGMDAHKVNSRKSLFGVLYLLAFAVVLSLLGFDLVMAMDPHWYSTLFGAYTFVKSFYVGLGAIIILAAGLHMNPNNGFYLAPSRFHDMGKLFFAFCLVWADFFYCQFVVIWYGNIPEETVYVLERTMRSPWQPLAWFVFFISFIGPFFILLNKRVKTMPRFMTVLCAIVILGIWLEHLLLVGPTLHHGAKTLPLGLSDGLIFLGFLGLMIASIRLYFRQFPEGLGQGAGGR